jgi:hypothetical protein
MLELIERARRSGVMIVTVVMGHYRPLPNPTELMSRVAKIAKALRSRTPAKLYIYETILKLAAGEFQGPVVCNQRLDL